MTRQPHISAHVSEVRECLKALKKSEKVRYMQQTGRMERGLMDRAFESLEIIEDHLREERP